MVQATTLTGAFYRDGLDEGTPWTIDGQEVHPTTVVAAHALFHFGGFKRPSASLIAYSFLHSFPSSSSVGPISFAVSMADLSDPGRSYVSPLVAIF